MGSQMWLHHCTHSSWPPSFLNVPWGSPLCSSLISVIKIASDCSLEENEKVIPFQQTEVGKKIQGDRNLMNNLVFFPCSPWEVSLLAGVSQLQLHLPQPVVPELSVWPIPGLIDWLRQFQGNRQPSGWGAECVSLFMFFLRLSSLPNLWTYFGNFYNQIYP